jgi:hypothetical protein
MKVELINQTNYANIYGIYEKSGKLIGTVEVRLAGRDVGTYCYSLCGKYNKRDIRRFYNTYKQ